MRSRKNGVEQSKLGLSLLLVIALPICGYGKKKPATSPPAPPNSMCTNVPVDTLRKAFYNEVDFVIDQIENAYVSGRRGLSDEQWKSGVDATYTKLEQFFDNNMEGYYTYIWRYLNLLRNDAHFKFPDSGMFNREGLFKEDDWILPLWVQTWTDGSVYNVKDYTGIIPRLARIESVNGRSAQEMALVNRAIAPGEDANAMAMMNVQYEANPRSWPNFANFLFMVNMRPPFQVVYTAQGSERPDTVTLQGITREEKQKLYVKSGDKRRTKQERGFSRKPIMYENLGDGLGVLSINSFWGKRWSALMLFGKDWRYKRLLRRAMARIDRNGIDNLVIDVSLNPGGMTENIYPTLGYFTDRPVDISQIYRITDNSRWLAKTNVDKSPELPEEARMRLIEYINVLPAGTTFCTDTVSPLRYTPVHPKHGYRGNVYVLTGHQTYSAAQMFARYCQKLDIGLTVGQHCGGFTEITGNAARVTLPLQPWMEFKVPFSANRICKEDDPYDYPPVDIPMDHPFGEWLNRENRSRDRLIEMIRSGNILKKTLSTSPD